ncbi:hypothetical protein ACGFZL_09390 [Streptomyces sp. NPDC048182]|uniref:hypothetical protein n=1 Tax=Streptomyces sp. NPDC048182 TaxID=3365507 RepID=UPI0037108678
MATTRHHLNSLRRRQAREAAQRTRPPAADGAVSTLDPPRDRRTPRQAPAARPAPAEPAPATEPRTTRRLGRGRLTLAVLALLVLLLGCFAGWAHGRAEGLRDDPGARNTALTDLARTSEIKGQTAKAVGALFSYDAARPAAFDKAAKELLTGRAVAQHKALFDAVRSGADRQKAVITTTVTDSAVERIDGDRARVLVYADQSSVATAGAKTPAKAGEKPAKDQAKDQGTYAGAMFAVDLLHRDGRWLVSGIDTFGR